MGQRLRADHPGRRGRHGQLRLSAGPVPDRVWGPGVRGQPAQPASRGVGVASPTPSTPRPPPGRCWPVTPPPPPRTAAAPPASSAPCWSPAAAPSRPAPRPSSSCAASSWNSTTTSALASTVDGSSSSTSACAALAGTRGASWRCGPWPAAGSTSTRRSATTTRTSPPSSSGSCRGCWPGLGVGPVCAAQLLVTAGDNPDRLHSEAAFAALCGVSPVEALRGKTQRHRLNRGGDRAANSALWIIANNRLMRTTHRTRAYAARRTATGPAARRSSGCSSATSPGRSSPKSATPSARLTPFPTTP